MADLSVDGYSTAIRPTLNLSPFFELSTVIKISSESRTQDSDRTTQRTQAVSDPTPCGSRSKRRRHSSMTMPRHQDPGAMTSTSQASLADGRKWSSRTTVTGKGLQEPVTCKVLRPMMISVLMKHLSPGFSTRQWLYAAHRGVVSPTIAVQNCSDCSVCPSRPEALLNDL